MDNDKRKRAEYLKPFTLTTILLREANVKFLVEENEGVNIILKPKAIKKKY